MRWQSILIAALLVSGATAARAQPADAPMSVMEQAVACAPPPKLSAGAPPAALQIIGAQDTVARALYEARDLLVVNGGTASGVDLGQQYFVRRRVGFGLGARSAREATVRTAAWIRIVAANATTSIATVTHLCDGIVEGDYLEPFVAPVVPAGADRADTAGALDFTSPGHVLYGDEERNTAGSGEFVLIDRGADFGVAPGAHFAVYRDVGRAGMPLAAIGEATVVAIGPALSLVRINQSRDAIRSGDFVVPRR
jgi:hypothetical protein